MTKEAQLMQWVRERERIAIGYSGGVDSVYLAAVAIAAVGADNVLGITGQSASYPESQWRAARETAERIGLTVVEIDTNELNDPNYAANPVNRCYFCKTELWSHVVPTARARGFNVVCDGTNADDLSDHRPGAQAAREHAIASPLAELGFSKNEIRAFSRARGLPTWEQPSSPCLSSRLPYGTAVTVERLRQVEVAEQSLRDLGVEGDLRVRHFGELARVELSPVELARWSAPENRARLDAAVVAAGYEQVELAGFRSGGLNVLAGIQRPA